MYYGECQVSVDEKGRVAVPVHFRAVMEVHDHDVWYMTRGFDKSVFLFHKEQWEKLQVQNQGASPLDPHLLDFRRLFLGSVSKVKRDAQGRLGVAAHLRVFAGIEREAVLLGVEDHLELWSVTGWLAFQERQAENYKAMAAELFGNKARAADNQGVLQGDEH